jgi:hypothetical protein
VLDGPSPAIQGLSGLSMAKDGTGGLVYLKDVAGVPHVFVSQLFGGEFSVPQQVDTALPGPSSDPVIAAAPGGMLVVAFINGGDLYATVAPAGPEPFGAPQALFDDATGPSVSATYLGKAYVAFTTEVDGVAQVRAAYYAHGSWALEPTPLNAVATENAGTGTDAPSVAAAQDGVGIVAWGEAGHVYLRRVWGASPSVDVYQVDVPTVGFDTEVSATDPRIAAGADSSFVDVAFDETVSNGTQQQTRVLLHQLDASVWSSLTASDGLATPGAESAGDPGVAMGEYGDGVATAVRGTSNQVWGMNLLNNGAPTSAIELDSLPNASPPDAISAASGFYSGLAAWQHDPGSPGTPEIRARFYTNHAWGPEVVLSNPADGATDAGAGLAAAGDLNADMAVAWVQGSGAGTQIVTDQLYQPPGGFSAASSFRYVRSTYPLLSWNAPHELWGPRYELSVDGAPPVETSQTSIRYGRLAQGPHTWSVEAVNGAGLTSFDKTATVFVDTYPPAVVSTLSGTLQVHKELHVYVTYSDTPPGATAADGSGVASVAVNWGDGSKYVIAHGKYHQYAKPGRYRLTVTVTDRAGNTTTKTEQLVIKPKPKPKPKHKRHKLRARG